MSQCEVELEFLKREFKARVKREKLGVEEVGEGSLAVNFLSLHNSKSMMRLLSILHCLWSVIYKAFFDREHRTSR